MVFGNMGNTSGTGVAFTRDPSTGEKKLYGEYLINAQGEDVVAGIRTPQKIETLQQVMPDVYEQFVNIAHTLENHYRDMQDMEYTIERGKLFMLQTRNGKRTAPAALKIAVDLVDEGMLTRKRLCSRWSPSSSTACCTRSLTLRRSRRRSRNRQGSARLSGRCLRHGVFHRRGR